MDTTTLFCLPRPRRTTPTAAVMCTVLNMYSFTIHRQLIVFWILGFLDAAANNFYNSSTAVENIRAHICRRACDSHSQGKSKEHQKRISIRFLSKKMKSATRPSLRVSRLFFAPLSSMKKREKPTEARKNNTKNL